MIINQQPGRYDRLPAWLRDLQFVTDFFSWLFALFSRLAEPLMLLCTLYIVAEAGVPSIALPALHNLAIGIMICAPEVILPGSFVVASRAQDHARLLFVVCWTFVLLTLLTLISLFVWHFTGEALAWLMCARCATAVGYSILMRVMHHHQVVQTQAAQVVQQQAIEERIEQAVHQVHEHLQVVQTELAGQVQTLVQSAVQNQMQVVQSTIVEQLSGQLAQAMQEMKRDLRSAIAEATASSESSSPKPARQLRSVPALVQNEPGNELASEPVSVRVLRFIQESIDQGHKPTLSEIEEACQCSRGSAIRYRRELLGEEEGVA